MWQRLRDRVKLSPKKKLFGVSGFFILTFLALSLSLSPHLVEAAKTFSSELNIAESSPLGESAGLIVPASCPSNLHDDPTYGQPCTSSPNACGQTSSGTYQCGGACNATAPPSSTSGSASCATYAGSYGIPPTHTQGTASYTQDCWGGITYNGGCYPPTPVCGNGQIESGETCDNGGGNGSCPATCSSSCANNSCVVCTENFGQASCAAYAGQYGIPPTHTQGTANYTQNSCTGAITYLGGCSAPVVCTETPGSASCATYAGSYGIPPTHTQGTASYTQNSCTGAITYLGGCSAPAPIWCGDGVCNGTENAISGFGDCGTCVANFGQPCTSNPNMCGMTGSGTIQCSGACNAVALPDTACGGWCGDGVCNGGESGVSCPADCSCSPMMGQACSSSPNTCGMTNPGTIQCNGSCNATPPSDALCGGPSYTITASAGAGGSISPSGFFSGIPAGSSRSFTITPNTGYNIATVIVNGVNQGAIGILTINNVNQNFTIVASFSVAAVGSPTVSISANPNPLAAGNSTTLTWTPSANVTSCWGSSPNGGAWDGWKSSTGGSLSVSPAATTHYDIECWNSGGISTGVQTVWVTVTAGPVPTLTFGASSTNITSGGSTILSWTPGGAYATNGCLAQGAFPSWNGWVQSTNGTWTRTVSPVSTTTYTLECYNVNGSSGPRSVTVTVTPAIAAAVTICPSSLTLPRTSSQQLRAYYTPLGTAFNGCGSPNGTDVTQNGGTTWIDDQPAVASVDNTAGSPTKGTVTGVNTGTATIRASYTGIPSSNLTVTVICSPTNSCTSAASQTTAATHCTGDTFTINDGCGNILTCSGTRTCDYNWKEVAP